MNPAKCIVHVHDQLEQNFYGNKIKRLQIGCTLYNYRTAPQQAEPPFRAQFRAPDMILFFASIYDLDDSCISKYELQNHSKQSSRLQFHSKLQSKGICSFAILTRRLNIYVHKSFLDIIQHDNLLRMVVKILISTLISLIGS